MHTLLYTFPCSLNSSLSLEKCKQHVHHGLHSRPWPTIPPTPRTFLPYSLWLTPVSVLLPSFPSFSFLPFFPSCSPFSTVIIPPFPLLDSFCFSLPVFTHFCLAQIHVFLLLSHIRSTFLLLLYHPHFYPYEPCPCSPPSLPPCLTYAATYVSLPHSSS